MTMRTILASSNPTSSTTLSPRLNPHPTCSSNRRTSPSRLEAAAEPPAPGDVLYACITARSKIRPTPATLGTPACVGPSETTNSQWIRQPPSRSPFSSTPPRTSPVSTHRHRP
ncbi:hypothetical protein BDZ89DRAFT_449020 [Hymenopellis radicata]|nr:hypothetical protein BDZ89DRAFT_449020 [Hymenopellis radicata]